MLHTIINLCQEGVGFNIQRNCSHWQAHLFRYSSYRVIYKYEGQNKMKWKGMRESVILQDPTILCRNSERSISEGASVSRWLSRRCNEGRASSRSKAPPHRARMRSSSSAIVLFRSIEYVFIGSRAAVIWSKTAARANWLRGVIGWKSVGRGSGTVAEWNGDACNLQIKVLSATWCGSPSDRAKFSHRITMKGWPLKRAGLIGQRFGSQLM